MNGSGSGMSYLAITSFSSSSFEVLVTAVVAMMGFFDKATSTAI